MQVHQLKNPVELTNEVAEWMTSLIQKTLTTQARFCLLLSGGNTPKSLYKLLAEDPLKKRIEWSRLHIFFGDERVVPFSDERNNGKMAFDTLLNKVPIPKNQLHYIQTNIDPSRAADAYNQILHQYFDVSEHTFDLALLGMGDDGHTLSLFPENASINQNKNWVFSIYLSSQQMHRITLSADVVNKSKHIAFLIAGASKSPVLNEILKGTAAPHTYPAQLINPKNGELHWFVDEAARGVDS